MQPGRSSGVVVPCLMSFVLVCNASGLRGHASEVDVPNFESQIFVPVVQLSL